MSYCIPLRICAVKTVHKHPHDRRLAMLILSSPFVLRELQLKLKRVWFGTDFPFQRRGANAIVTLRCTYAKF